MPLRRAHNVRVVLEPPDRSGKTASHQRATRGMMSGPAAECVGPLGSVTQALCCAENRVRLCIHLGAKAA